MTWQTFLSVLSATIGLVSGVWLCYGAALITPKRVARAADDSWDADPGIAEALISQSAEYFAGALLLMAAFLGQIFAAQASQTALAVSSKSVFSNVWVLVACAILLSMSVSFPVYKLRKRWLEKRV